MTKKEIAYSMIQSGASTDEIAEKTGISKVYVREIRRNTIPKITISDYEDKICSMREDGKTYEEIGREIGYSASTIKNFLQKVRQERKIIENAECKKNLTYAPCKPPRSYRVSYQGKRYLCENEFYIPR